MIQRKQRPSGYLFLSAEITRSKSGVVWMPHFPKDAPQGWAPRRNHHPRSRPDLAHSALSTLFLTRPTDCVCPYGHPSGPSSSLCFSTLLSPCHQCSPSLCPPSCCSVTAMKAGHTDFYLLPCFTAFHVSPRPQNKVQTPQHTTCLPPVSSSLRCSLFFTF